jgi:membrane dipeptidase
MSVVATLEDVADHVDHAVKIAGIDHVGIGSDFDGIAATANGLEDVSKMPALVAVLLKRDSAAHTPMRSALPGPADSLPTAL